jgi:hypothetical protein
MRGEDDGTNKHAGGHVLDRDMCATIDVGMVS